MIAVAARLTCGLFLGALQEPDAANGGASTGTDPDLRQPVFCSFLFSACIKGELVLLPPVTAVLSLLPVSFPGESRAAALQAGCTSSAGR